MIFLFCFLVRLKRSIGCSRQNLQIYGHFKFWGPQNLKWPYIGVLRSSKTKFTRGFLSGGLHAWIGHAKYV
jgi:hypothetical protein